MVSTISFSQSFTITDRAVISRLLAGPFSCEESGRQVLAASSTLFCRGNETVGHLVDVMGADLHCAPGRLTGTASISADLATNRITFSVRVTIQQPLPLRLFWVPMRAIRYFLNRDRIRWRLMIVTREALKASPKID